MNNRLRNNVIYIDTLLNKSEFLRFWKLHYSTDIVQQANVSILNRKSINSDNPHNALIILSSSSKPQLYHLDNGIYIFASVQNINEYPRNLEVVAIVYNEACNPVSYILKDLERKIIYVPFSLDAVLQGFYFERYISGSKTCLPRPILNIYYMVKKILPTTVRSQLRVCFSNLQQKQQFPGWPIEKSLEDFKSFILELLLSVSRTKTLPFIWFWPQGKESCLLLTHDIESGLRSNSGISRFIEIEKELGFKSSFNIVPFKYALDGEIIQEILSAGHEIGVHGYSHDGKLFSSKRIFKRRIKRVNEIASEWGATGFRSASTFRNPEWFTMMDFDYDSSFFDTDPYEPQPGGCLSYFPYLISGIVELPITMPQDHTLFNILKEEDIDIWKQKAIEIKKRNGIINSVTHPDKGYIMDPEKEKYYIDFLEWLRHDKKTWNVLPREAAKWWRKRNHAEIVVEDSRLCIKNELPEMYIRIAELVKGKLQFQNHESEWKSDG